MIAVLSMHKKCIKALCSIHNKFVYALIVEPSSHVLIADLLGFYLSYLKQWNFSFFYSLLSDLTFFSRPLTFALLIETVLRFFSSLAAHVHQANTTVSRPPA